jgi:hypothetical protein
MTPADSLSKNKTVALVIAVFGILATGYFLSQILSDQGCPLIQHPYLFPGPRNRGSLACVIFDFSAPYCMARGLYYALKNRSIAEYDPAKIHKRWVTEMAAEVAFVGFGLLGMMTLLVLEFMYSPVQWIP